jgi:hypothetical protein
MSARVHAKTSLVVDNDNDMKAKSKCSSIFRGVAAMLLGAVLGT